jgi:hypothetical protein
MTGNEIDVGAVTDDAAAAGSGIPHAEALLAFTEAAVLGSEAELSEARQRLRDAVGSEGLVDAAAVVGNFERMTRIADSTGIPLDPPVNVLAGDLQEDLGLTEFGSARNTSPPGALAGLLAPALRKVSVPIFRLLHRVSGWGER